MRASRLAQILCGSSATIYSICSHTTAKLPVRHTVGGSKFKIIIPAAVQIRNLGLGPTSKEFEEPIQVSGPITKVHASELVLRMTENERKMLHKALEEYESNKIKEEFEDKLAGLRWRSKFGRPSKVTTLGDVDPTGSYCPVPEDWLNKKYAATVEKPTTKQLLHLLLSNSIPFIGFGFLDNFIMIIAGDRIESSMSTYMTLSTMGAAALGNTISDIIGIGSSCYVERAAIMVGLGGPALSPAQLALPISRRFANGGRVFGITIGCFVGMTPLLFKDDEKKPDPKPTPVVNQELTKSKESK